ncbi:golgin subfamily A member 1-like isoform X3 [Dermacentor albipictus]|uniref:golgin subfamily A member 1-like isoform X3 n=1 Tax=Dermacentor albipictus TaxID=60249 RepID=UPI0038FC1531
MFTKLKKKIEEENQTELVIGIPPPPPQLPAPTPTHSRRASDCGVSTPGRSTCSEASDSDREQRPKKLPHGNSTENDNSKHKGSTPKRSAPTGVHYDEMYHKLQLIKREKQELERQLRESEQRVELLAGRCENREEIESFQNQEMAKVKHLLLCSQQELRAADERLRQRSQEVLEARSRAAELEKALSEGGEQARARDLERDKTALEAEVDCLKQDALQATTMMDEKDRHISDLEDKVHILEKRLEGTSLTGDEHIQSLVEEASLDSGQQLAGACCQFVSTFVADHVKMAWDPLQLDPGSPLHEGGDLAASVAHERGGTTVPLAEAKCYTRVEQLRSFLRRWRHRHNKHKHSTTILKCASRRRLPRKELEKKLDESRQHLFEVKTSWSDKINNLEAQIFNLNEKMAEDSQEYSRMEKLLAEAQQLLKDQQQQRAKLEEQLLARDTEMAKMRRSHEEELQRQRALQDSQLDELRMQAADLRAQLTQAQRDRDRETSQAQARISALETSQTEFVEREIEAEKQVTALENTGRRLKVELNKKEAECRKSQEQIQGLEANHKTSLEKVSKLERQLSLVLHSETILKHSLKKSEAELKTMKEDLAVLEQKLTSAETENKQLTEELEAKQQQADEQRARLEGEVAQLQESLCSVKKKVEQLEKEAATNESNNTSLSDLESKVAGLEDQVSEKNKMLKLQQQRISDMKKALQKELKSHQGAATAAAVLSIEGAPSATSDVPPPSVDHSSGLGSAGDSVARAGTKDARLATQPRGPDSKLEDDINFKYLKHVVFKFMTSKEYEAQHLIRAVSVLLRFTADEEQMIREHLDWKNSWFGTRPQPHHHGHNSHDHHRRSSATFANHPKGNTKTT